MIRTLTFFGDSLTEGNAYGPDVYSGGKGNWIDLLSEWFNSTNLLGPIISSGMIPVYQAYWSKAGTWTQVTTADAFDKQPYSVAYYANGASNTTKYTSSPWLRAPVGFAVYWTDYASGGNWQYRVDGGTWTNMNQSRQSDNKLCKFYVSGTITSSIEFRGNDGSSDCGVLINGIELYYLPPTTANGFIIHNLGHSGDTFRNLIPTGSADQMAIVDNVRLGTGSPNSPYPTDACATMNLNDVFVVNNLTTWANDLSSFYARCSPICTTGFMNPWECSPIFYPLTRQANYRAQTKSSAASLGAKILDHYDLWQLINITSYQVGINTGLLGDGTHPLEAGEAIIAYRIWWWILQNFLNTTPTRSQYTSIAKQSSSYTFLAHKTNQVMKASMPLGAR